MSFFQLLACLQAQAFAHPCRESETSEFRSFGERSLLGLIQPDLKKGHFRFPSPFWGPTLSLRHNRMVLTKKVRIKWLALVGTVFVNTINHREDRPELAPYSKVGASALAESGLEEVL